MCRNITTLRGLEPAATAEEIEAAARQYVRKVSGVQATSRASEEAFELANGTEYGLQAGIFTGSVATAMAAGSALEFGGVLVNEAPTFRADQMPYGGVKASGNTKEGPHYSVREMTEERLVVIAR